MRDALMGGLKNIIKPFIPEPLKEKLRKIYAELRSPESVFTEIYVNKTWGEQGTKGLYSGPGSRGLVAEKYAEMIREFIAAHNISSVLDLGCGDFMVGKCIAEAAEQYTGADVVKLVVDHHTEHFGSEKVQFRHLDIVKDELPNADLCLIRQVLQHLSNDQILKILPKLDKFRFVIITEHYPAKKKFVAFNRDKQHGPDTRLRQGSAVYLDKPPFSAKSTELLLDVAADDIAADTRDCDAGYIRSFLVKV